MADLVIRPMQRPDLDLAIAWAAAEGWNPGQQDASSFWAADPQGFFIGELAGEPVSCISAVAYDRTFGFIGFYIVQPAFRGRGYGWQTWQHALTYLGDRTIGLDGVVAQQDNYRRSGFMLAYRQVRYQGSEPVLEPTPPLQPIATVPLADLLAFEAQFFPVPREAFLAAWCQQPGSVGLVQIANDRIVGYGVIRPCQVGWKIGPLFALDAIVADAIFRGLAAHTGGAPYIFDVPEPNSAAVQLAERYGMTPVFETARMYLGQPPNVTLSGVFGVTTFELG